MGVRDQEVEKLKHYLDYNAMLRELLFISGRRCIFLYCKFHYCSARDRKARLVADALCLSLLFCSIVVASINIELFFKSLFVFLFLSRSGPISILVIFTMTVYALNKPLTGMQ